MDQETVTLGHYLDGVLAIADQSEPEADAKIIKKVARLAAHAKDKWEFISSLSQKEREYLLDPIEEGRDQVRGSLCYIAMLLAYFEGIKTTNLVTPRLLETWIVRAVTYLSSEKFFRVGLFKEVKDSSGKNIGLQFNENVDKKKIKKNFWKKGYL